jgi:hypothetical protein
VEQNIVAAWIAFLFGALAGAVAGLLFHDEAWLGGYGSWRRRLMRLGHVAFFGIGFINLGFGLTVQALGLASRGIDDASFLLIVGLITMPLVCYLAAWKKGFRHLFIVPVGSVVVAVALTIFALR